MKPKTRRRFIAIAGIVAIAAAATGVTIGIIAAFQPRQHVIQWSLPGTESAFVVMNWHRAWAAGVVNGVASFATGNGSAIAGAWSVAIATSDPVEFYLPGDESSSMASRASLVAFIDLGLELGGAVILPNVTYAMGNSSSIPAIERSSNGVVAVYANVSGGVADFMLVGLAGFNITLAGQYLTIVQYS
jgi:hypothetical protein